jgi:hypothetical protein
VLNKVLRMEDEIRTEHAPLPVLSRVRGYTLSVVACLVYAAVLIGIAVLTTGNAATIWTTVVVMGGPLGCGAICAQFIGPHDSMEPVRRFLYVVWIPPLLIACVAAIILGDFAWLLLMLIVYLWLLGLSLLGAGLARSAATIWNLPDRSARFDLRLADWITGALWLIAWTSIAAIFGERYWTYLDADLDRAIRSVPVIAAGAGFTAGLAFRSRRSWREGMVTALVMAMVPVLTVTFVWFSLCSASADCETNAGVFVFGYFGVLIAPASVVGHQFGRVIARSARRLVVER